MKGQFKEYQCQHQEREWEDEVEREDSGGNIVRYPIMSARCTQKGFVGICLMGNSGDLCPRNPDNRLAELVKL